MASLASLLDVVPPDQQRFVQLIASTYAEQGCWPVAQYVQSYLAKDGIDLDALLLRIPTYTHRYSLYIRRRQHAATELADRFELTVYGLARCESEAAAPPLAGFLAALRVLATAQSAITPKPDAVVEASLSSEELVARIQSACDI